MSTAAIPVVVRRRQSNALTANVSMPRKANAPQALIVQAGLHKTAAEAFRSLRVYPSPHARS